MPLPQIQKATRTSKRVKIALMGTAGSGKTYTALAIAKGLGPKVLCIDTEHGSAASYAEFDFDTIELDSFAPQTYVEAVQLAEKEGYDVVILDSLSHAWIGKDGAIEMADKAAKRSGSGNSFTAWKDVTPEHNKMIEAIVGARVHVIATLRSKTEYIVEQGKNGKSAPRKVGLAPVQRDGLEYEFDVVGTMDETHALSITKSRIEPLSDAVIERPGADVAAIISQWLQTASPVVAAPLPSLRPLTEKGKTLIREQAEIYWGETFELDLAAYLQQTYERSLNHLTADEGRALCESLKAWNQERTQEAIPEPAAVSATAAVRAEAVQVSPEEQREIDATFEQSDDAIAHAKEVFAAQEVPVVPKKEKPMQARTILLLRETAEKWGHPSDTDIEKLAGCSFTDIGEATAQRLIAQFEQPMTREEEAVEAANRG